MPATKAARPASFDRTQQRRRAMIGKVHVDRKALAMDEDDYRQIIADVSGQTSLAKCSETELGQILDRLKALGAKPATKSRAAQHSMAKKARALWISLYQLGEVPDLIEALKKRAERNGWKQTGPTGGNLSVRDLKRGLCEAILAKLVACGEVPAHWTIDIAAHRLCGIDTGSGRFANAEGFADLAEALGRKLREADPKLRGAS